MVPRPPLSGVRWSSMAPVIRVFPADVRLHRLEIRLRASPLSPYHAGPATPHRGRLGVTAAFLACNCSFHLPDPGEPSDPRPSLSSSRFRDDGSFAHRGGCTRQRVYAAAVRFRG